MVILPYTAPCFVVAGGALVGFLEEGAYGRWLKSWLIRCRPFCQRQPQAVDG